MINMENAIIGIELGSTRIKTVLLDETHSPVASGSFEWENSYENNNWTYAVEDVWMGIQQSYLQMADQAKQVLGQEIKKIGALGISAMMHGYLAFDAQNKLLVPFRTWRNNYTGKASAQLTELFNFPIPQRWSISHLYNAIINNETHVKDLRYITTLAGYVHWKLTGEKVLGVGDASGMFPIGSDTNTFDGQMIQKFNKNTEDKGFDWKLEEVLPKVLAAGKLGGTLTSEGAKLLDVSGTLESGVPMCPPEGDAGTGMVATNSVSERTGNVSAGTSVFAMIVLEKPLSKVYPELDLVTTPDGKPVAMVHSNNCSSDLDAWVGLFDEAYRVAGVELDKSDLYQKLLVEALKGDVDCGGLLSYGYVSGEHITHFDEGRPLFVRGSKSKFNLANFMRVNLYSALGALKTGLTILQDQEKVNFGEITGHGGFFKTPVVGQKVMAACFNAPVSLMETAGEGGAWGIGLLAAFMKNKEKDETLDGYLSEKVFKQSAVKVMEPDSADVEGFNEFMTRYHNGLPIERAAVENLN